jgi:hypothetical protein
MRIIVALTRIQEVRDADACGRIAQAERWRALRCGYFGRGRVSAGRPGEVDADLPFLVASRRIAQRRGDDLLFLVYAARHVRHGGVPLVPHAAPYGLERSALCSNYIVRYNLGHVYGIGGLRVKRRTCRDTPTAIGSVALIGAVVMSSRHRNERFLQAPKLRS